jgi:hypothetical protein
MYEYLILSKIGNNNSIFIDLMIIIIILPILKIFTSYIENNIETVLTKIRRNNTNTIILTGWNSIKNGIFYFDYPYNMNAIFHYVTKNKLAKNLKFLPIERNNLLYIEDVVNAKVTNHMNYILDENQTIKITDDINIELISYKMNTENDKANLINTTTWKIDLIIKSKSSITNVQEFLNKTIKEYAEYENSKSKNIIYHFIYQGWDSDRNKPIFSQSVLSNLENDSEKSFETFDNLFSEHKDQIMKSIDRLKDIDYYKRTGFKRKLGYLFYGPPGCGKTSHVIAMANYDKNHIVEVPLTRVKNNKEIETIININNINEMKIDKNNLIILFDEIDQIDKVLNKDEKSSELKDIVNLISQNKTNIVDNNDTLSLGYILSRLDGVGNYNGIKIVATTNHKEKLSPALYRDGRLSPLFFDLSSRKTIHNIMCHYYQKDIDIERIPDIKIAPSSLKKYLEDYQYDIDGLVGFLNKQ